MRQLSDYFKNASFLLCGAATYAVLAKKKQRMEERNR